MSIDEYKAALRNMIDSTDDEQLLKHWKAHLEPEFEKYQRKLAAQAQQTSSTESTTGSTRDKDDDEGYVVLESGLGIDE